VCTPAHHNSYNLHTFTTRRVNDDCIFVYYNIIIDHKYILFIINNDYYYYYYYIQFYIFLRYNIVYQVDDFVPALSKYIMTTVRSWPSPHLHYSSRRVATYAIRLDVFPQHAANIMHASNIRVPDIKYIIICFLYFSRCSVNRFDLVCEFAFDNQDVSTIDDDYNNNNNNNIDDV